MKVRKRSPPELPLRERLGLGGVQAWPPQWSWALKKNLNKWALNGPAPKATEKMFRRPKGPGKYFPNHSRGGGGGQGTPIPNPTPTDAELLSEALVTSDG